MGRKIVRASLCGVVMLAVLSPVGYGYVIGYDMEQVVQNTYYPYTPKDATANVLNSSDLLYNAGVMGSGAVQTTEQVKFGQYSCKCTVASAYLNPRPNASMELTGSNNAFTVMGYIYLLADTTDQKTVACASASGYGFVFNLYVYNKQLHFQVRANSSTYYEIVTADTIPAGTWVHVAGTFSQGALKAYINGTPKASGMAPFTAITNNLNAYGYVGNDIWGDALGGYVDDFYFNSAEALAPEVVAFYSVNTASPPLVTSGAAANVMNPGNYVYDAGTIAGGATQTTEQHKFGQYSFKFVGPDNASLTPFPDTAMGLTGSNSQMTVMAHVYLLTNTTGQRCVASSTAAAGSRWILYLNNQRLYFGACNGTTYSEFYSSSTITTANTWVHLAATFNSGVVKVYINGVQKASGTAPFAQIPANASAVGRVGVDNASHVLNGYIDDFYFNSEQALSATQIASYMTATIAPPIALTGTLVLPGYTGNLGIVCAGIDLWQGGVKVQALRPMLNPDGTFSAAVTTPGTYDVTVKTYAHVGATILNVAIQPDATDLGTITLAAGDANGDNQVTAADLTLLLANLDRVGR